MDKLVQASFRYYRRASRELYDYYKSFNTPGVVVGLKEVGVDFVFFFLKRSRLVEEGELEVVETVDQLLPDEFALYILVDDPEQDDLAHFEIGAIARDYWTKKHSVEIDFAGKNASPCTNPLCRDRNASLYCKKCGAAYCARPCQRRHWEEHKKSCGNDADFNPPDE
jgi:hypothetical protein